jgi:hypothetical protein
LEDYKNFCAKGLPFGGTYTFMQNEKYKGTVTVHFPAILCIHDETNDTPPTDQEIESVRAASRSIVSGSPRR